MRRRALGVALGGSENFYSVFEAELSKHIPVVHSTIGGIMISHNSQFVDTLCPVIWHLENNTLNLLGDADWMREQSKIKIDDKDKVDESECVDKFGNTVKVKAGKKKLTNKEKKARSRRRANRIKNGLDPLSEDESTDEE